MIEYSNIHRTTETLPTTAYLRATSVRKARTDACRCPAEAIPVDRPPGRCGKTVRETNEANRPVAHGD